MGHVCEGRCEGMVPEDRFREGSRECFKDQFWERSRKGSMTFNLVSKAFPAFSF